MILEGTVLEPLELLEVLKEGRRDEFKGLLRTQPETVLDAAFEEASRDERLEFLRLMPVERAANTFTDLSLEDQTDFSVASGWKHDALGFVVFFFIGATVLSTDRLIRAWLAPQVDAAVVRLAFDRRQFAGAEFQLPECADVLADLRRTAGADQRRRDARIAQHPGQRHLRQALAARLRDLVERGHAGEIGRRQVLAAERAAAGAVDAGVGGDAAEVLVAQ